MNDKVHVVCPRCSGVNRLPASRLTDQPNCGKCHQPLFTGHPVDLGDTELSRQIDRSELPVLVDFWASWCGPCKMMAPAYEQAAQELEPRVRVVKVNTELAPASAARFNIRSIPTLMLFKAGREVGRQAGAMGAQDILRWVRAHA